MFWPCTRYPNAEGIDGHLQDGRGVLPRFKWVTGDKCQTRCIELHPGNRSDVMVVTACSMRVSIRHAAWDPCHR